MELQIYEHNADAASLQIMWMITKLSTKKHAGTREREPTLSDMGYRTTVNDGMHGVDGEDAIDEESILR